MRRIADAEQSGPHPLIQPVDTNRQQPDLRPVVDGLQPSGVERRHRGDALLQRRQPGALQRLKLPFLDREAALPVVAAIDNDKVIARAAVAGAHRGIVRLLVEPKPDHVARRAEGAAGQPRLRSDRRMPPIGADHQLRADSQRLAVAQRGDAAHPILLDDQLAERGRGQQPEAGKGGALVGEKVKEIPLRHKGDKAAAHRQAREIGHRHLFPAHFRLQLFGALVRQRQQLIQQAQMVHHLQRGGMNGVAAKIAQKVGVFFNDDHLQARARQQVAGHQARRAAADDAAVSGKRL